jgi:predicted RNA-binding Zn-ribbon protein involved in translation (DUF1610 family)
MIEKSVMHKLTESIQTSTSKIIKEKALENYNNRKNLKEAHVSRKDMLVKELKDDYKDVDHLKNEISLELVNTEELQRAVYNTRQPNHAAPFMALLNVCRIEVEGVTSEDVKRAVTEFAGEDYKEVLKDAIKEVDDLRADRAEEEKANKSAKKGKSIKEASFNDEDEEDNEEEYHQKLIDFKNGKKIDEPIYCDQCGKEITNKDDLQGLSDINTRYCKDCWTKMGNKINNEPIIDEAEETEGKDYRYITNHGIGPGTLPNEKGLYIKSEDLPNGKTAIYLSRPLTSEELKKYDIKPEWIQEEEETPETSNKRKQLPNISKFIYDLDKGNAWSANDYTKDILGNKLIRVNKNGKSSLTAEDVKKKVEDKYPKLIGRISDDGSEVWFYLRKSQNESEHITEAEETPENEEKEDTTLATKEDGINFLIDDEDEAIDGYNDVLDRLNEYDLSDEDKELYTRKMNEIIEDEERHIKILNGLLEGKDIPDEKEDEEHEESEEKPEGPMDEASPIDFPYDNTTDKVCPKCGKHYTQFPALSRRDNATWICPDCGKDEAMEDYLDASRAKKNK